MSKKILIVEDEEIMLELLRQKIIKEGYDTLTAQDGEEALKLIKEEKPDLVLLDIILPRKGGFEVMEDMAGDPVSKKIPIIIISNSGQPVELERAKRLGAKDWLIKTNFEPEEVLEKVKKQINK